MRKKICVVTGSRAEYGLLKLLIERINNDEDLQLQIIATGMHLSPEFGMTYQEIVNDGYEVDEKIEILLSSDTSIGISKSIGLSMISFSECYHRLQPDLVLLLGDRFEIFAAACAAYVSNIPIAHLHGGETTEGALDEGFRHSITKMSFLHFTSTREYKNRVIQLGEDPCRVFNVGALGVENIKIIQLYSKEEIEKIINFKITKPTILVTFHPVTLEKQTAGEQINNLLEALDSFKDLKIIFTKTSSDPGGRIINQKIEEYVSLNADRAVFLTSMGSKNYLSTMQFVEAILGNSSSGIIEAPVFKIPTINIGDRQKGRIQADTVINCKAAAYDIRESLKKALNRNFRRQIINSRNPYGDGNVSTKVISILKQQVSKDFQLKKIFYDLIDNNTNSIKRNEINNDF